MANTDESMTILHICNKNLLEGVRNCVVRYFNDKLEIHILNAKKVLSVKDKIIKRAQANFQRELQKICKNIEINRKEGDIFFENLITELPYLKDLLGQILKKHILLLSQIRTSNAEVIEIDAPDIHLFSIEILNKNCYTLFYNVEKYYASFQKKNYEDCKTLIDNTTENVLTSLHNSVYKSFFIPSKKEKISPFQNAIEASKLDGVAPDDSNRSFEDIPDNRSDNNFKLDYKKIAVNKNDLECVSERGTDKCDKEESVDREATEVPNVECEGGDRGEINKECDEGDERHSDKDKSLIDEEKYDNFSDKIIDFDKISEKDDEILSQF